MHYFSFDSKKIYYLVNFIRMINNTTKIYLKIKSMYFRQKLNINIFVWENVGNLLNSKNQFSESSSSFIT